jgi:hypothetical protein
MCRGMPRPWSYSMSVDDYMSVDDVQRDTLYIEHSILALSIASGPPAASLPPKLGYTEAANVEKLYISTMSSRVLG